MPYTEITDYMISSCSEKKMIWCQIFLGALARPLKLSDTIRCPSMRNKKKSLHEAPNFHAACQWGSTTIVTSVTLLSNVYKNLGVTVHPFATTIAVTVRTVWEHWARRLHRDASFSIITRLKAPLLLVRQWDFWTDELMITWISHGWCWQGITTGMGLSSF